MSVQVEVDGLKDFNKALKKFGDDLPKLMSKLHKKLAEPVARRAASKAPKKSGKLARSVRPFGSRKAASVGAGKKSVPYAAVQHWGWPKHNIKGRPFMQEAIQGMEKTLVDDYAKFIDEVMDEALKKGSG